MSAATVISVEQLSKAYRLGLIGGGTLRGDLARWWARVRGRPDPLLRVGEEHKERREGEVFWALRGVEFRVRQGEVLGVIGRNGAGKSTLLKILSRVTGPTEGCVRLRGRVASLLEVGTGFHPELTGRENVFLNGAILGMTKAEIRRKFDEIIAFADIEGFVDTPVKRYSSGMYVRLAFAVAAHLEPEILIVDEVLAVGDAQFQAKCLGKMKDVAGQGRTVLFVSHNMQAVSTLTTRCLVMRGGQCAVDARPAEAIAAYLSEVVKEGSVYVAPAAAGRPRVTRLEVETSEPAGRHGFGKPLRVKIEVTTPGPVRRGALSFQVMDAMMQPVTHTWVTDGERPMLREAGVHRFVCTYPNPRLYLGRYTLTVHLAEGEGGEHFETTEGLCPFEIVMHGHTREWSWREGVARYLEESAWEVTPPAGRGAERSP